MRLNGDNRTWSFVLLRIYMFHYILSLVFLLLSKDTAELFFEDVRLPADALLGELNKGFCYLMNELPQVNTTFMACSYQ